MEKKEKKKKIGLHFLKMIVLFVIVFLVQQTLMTLLSINIAKYKYGEEVIGEAVWAVLVIFIIIITKKSYIFKQERENIGKSLRFGAPIIAISMVFLILNSIAISSKINASVLKGLLNCLMLCTLIGIVEEFLCRGWLLNSFLERFGNNKKNILLSIILSSLIFGFIHFTNVAGGQSLLLTTMQALNATLIGMIFAFIYYKTKNIWSVVFIHAFWDFALFVGESVYLGDEVYSDVTNTILMWSIVSVVILCLALGIICVWYAKQINFPEDTDKKPMSKPVYVLLPLISIAIYLFGNLYAPEGYSEYAKHIEYESKSLGKDYDTHYYNHDEYELLIDENESVIGESVDEVKNQYKFKLYVKDEKLVFQNLNTDQEVVLLENKPGEYIMLENEDSYWIMIRPTAIITTANTVFYGKFDKTDISNELEYLNKVKDGVAEYNVPSYETMGSIDVDGYSYAFVRMPTSQRVYFDKENNIYLDE